MTKPYLFSRVAWRLLLLACVLLHSACGGGGGGGGDDSGDGASRSGDDEPGLLLRGSVLIPEAHVVDHDVNDPQGQNGAPNNPPDSTALPGKVYPQPLVNNPVAVVGYVNRPRQGPSGASWAQGDVDDYYRVQLRAGQIITLSYLAVDDADLDLYLYNAPGDTMLDGSAGTAGREQIQIDADGTYIVDVFAAEGASNYVLTIGLAAMAQDYTAVNLRHEFIAGEALVSRRRSGSAFALSAAEPEQDVEHLMLPLADAPDDINSARSAALPAYVDTDGYRDKVAMIPDSLRPKWYTLLQLKALRHRADVMQAMPNGRVHAHRLPADPRYGAQWHYPLINLPQAWDLTRGQRDGDDIIVAVVDSGILSAHPDLQGQLVAGYDFVSDVSNAGDGDGRDPDPEDVRSSSHHGTHVAGTIAAASDNGIGVAGVAWRAKIMPLRALGLNGGTTADMLEAVKYAAGLPNASGRLPERRADIINLSLGTVNAGCLRLPVDPVSQQVFRRVRDAGVIVIAAAGNDNCSQPGYPASFDGVMSVSAVGVDRLRPSYANFGPSIDLVAPGGSVDDVNADGASDFVISTLGFRRGDGTTEYRYGGMLGTSMATPHVSGVVALMSAVAEQGLTPQQLDALLRSGQITEDLGAAGRDDSYGYGLIDAYQAVLAAGGAPQQLDPALGIVPASLNFGSVQTQLPLYAINQGGGDLQVDSVVADADWLTVLPPDSGDGLGDYLVAVNRTGLAEGNYFGSLSVASSLGERTVGVAMSVSRSSQSQSNAGRHYVLLIDALSNRVVQTVAAERVGGRYRYQFSGVEGNREYVIVAGNDLDNDLLLCAGADACGAYPTWSEQQRVTVAERSLSGLDFSTSYLVPLNSASGFELRSPLALPRSESD